MTHRFVLVDVFTDRPFGGNQLAVFPDAQGISDTLMQFYARELNFSETTFVLPPRKPGHTHRVRIFTPHEELPFAGHPNVGTAVVLASLAEDSGAGHSFIFDEGVGTVHVTAKIVGGHRFAELTLEGEAEIRACDLPRTTLADMLGLREERLGHRAPWMAGIGIRFCCIPLADFDAVAAARFDTAIWETAFPPDSWTRQIYALAGDFAPGGTIKVRMWAPGAGVAEDPATGSAAGILAASLAAVLPDQDGVFTWTVEQGAEIGRPSFISAAAVKRDGRVVSIRVGGKSVIVGEGGFTETTLA